MFLQLHGWHWDKKLQPGGLLVVSGHANISVRHPMLLQCVVVRLTGLGTPLTPSTKERKHQLSAFSFITGKVEEFVFGTKDVTKKTPHTNKAQTPTVSASAHRELVCCVKAIGSRAIFSAITAG